MPVCITCSPGVIIHESENGKKQAVRKGEFCRFSGEDCGFYMGNTTSWIKFFNTDTPANHIVANYFRIKMKKNFASIRKSSIFATSIHVKNTCKKSKRRGV